MCIFSRRFRYPPAATGPGPAGPSGAPEKLATPTAKPTAKYDHTRQSRPAFHANDHAHDTPARTIHPVKIAVSDGSAVTGRQYRDPCVRGVSRSLGRWGVEQAATKNKHPHRHCRNLHHTTVTSATAAISITVTSTNAPPPPPTAPPGAPTAPPRAPPKPTACARPLAAVGN